MRRRPDHAVKLGALFGVGAGDTLVGVDLLQHPFRVSVDPLPEIALLGLKRVGLILLVGGHAAVGRNLNIPRYVDTFEPEPEIDLNAVAKEIRSVQAEIKDIDAKLKPYFKELGLDFPFE